MIALRYFERADFELLLSWNQSEEFLTQWSGNTFIYQYWNCIEMGMLEHEWQAKK